MCVLVIMAEEEERQARSYVFQKLLALLKSSFGFYVGLSGPLKRATNGLEAYSYTPSVTRKTAGKTMR